MERIALLTSGGDAPGMNAAVRAATRAAIARGWEVFGVRNGYAGLLADNMQPLHARDVGGIIQRGGTVLGSARSAEFREHEGLRKAAVNLRNRGIHALIVIGGNGSQTGSARLHETGFPVVGIASTIDNDLMGTNVTIGVDTAVNTTLQAIDMLRTTASSHQRAFLVETMGRKCGYIALMTGIAGGAEVIVTPECDVEPEEVVERLGAAYLRAYGRPATAEEIAAAREFLRTFEARLAASANPPTVAGEAGAPDPEKRRLLAWQGFCQLLFASSEFVYVN